MSLHNNFKISFLLILSSRFDIAFLCQQDYKQRGKGSNGEFFHRASDILNHLYNNHVKLNGL